ncbi:MAG: hypothetical protein JSS34_02650 [Proteobacteria bacterium]|nr:hypothetical protein [Pseudomonadota bacterium]
MKNRLYHINFIGMILFGFMVSSFIIMGSETSQASQKANVSNITFERAVSKILEAAHLYNFVINTEDGPLQLVGIEKKDHKGNVLKNQFDAPVIASYEWKKGEDFTGAINANAADIDNHYLTRAVENALKDLKLVPKDISPQDLHDLGYAYVKSIKNIFYDELISYYHLQSQTGDNDMWGVLYFQKGSSMHVLPLEPANQLQHKFSLMYENAIKRAFMTPYGDASLRWHIIPEALKEILKPLRFQSNS